MLNTFWGSPQTRLLKKVEAIEARLSAESRLSEEEMLETIDALNVAPLSEQEAAEIFKRINN